MTQAPKAFAEAIRLATEEFERKLKKQHDDLLKQGYKLIAQCHDEWTYLSPIKAVVSHGKLTGKQIEVTVPCPELRVTTKMQRAAVVERLSAIFPRARVNDIGYGDIGTELSVEIEGDFEFKFSDMPKLAEAFGTEHLNFRQTEKEDGYRYSSYTWDSGTSQRLFIDARYEEPCDP